MAQAFRDPNGAARYALRLTKRRKTKKAVPRKPSPTTVIRRLREELAAETLMRRRAQSAAPIPFVWQTGDGQSVKPSAMDEGHLRNAISYVQRRLVHECGRAPWMGSVKKWAQALYEFLQETERRGIKV